MMFVEFKKNIISVLKHMYIDIEYITNLTHEHNYNLWSERREMYFSVFINDLTFSKYQFSL